MGFHCLVSIFPFMNMKQRTKTCCNKVGVRSNSWHRIVSLFHIMPVKKVNVWVLVTLTYILIWD